MNISEVFNRPVFITNILPYAALNVKYLLILRRVNVGFYDTIINYMKDYWDTIPAVIVEDFFKWSLMNSRHRLLTGYESDDQSKTVFGSITDCYLVLIEQTLHRRDINFGKIAMAEQDRVMKFIVNKGLITDYGELFKFCCRIDLTDEFFFLIDKGHVPSQTADADGKTLLHHACRSNKNTMIIEYLLDAGLDPHALDNDRVVCYERLEARAEIFRTKGVDILSQGGRFTTTGALYYYVRQAYGYICRLMITEGYDFFDDSINTYHIPIVMAIQYGSESFVKSLLDTQSVKDGSKNCWLRTMKILLRKPKIYQDYEIEKGLGMLVTDPVSLEFARSADTAHLSGVSVRIIRNGTKAFGFRRY